MDISVARLEAIQFSYARFFHSSSFCFMSLLRVTNFLCSKMYLVLLFSPHLLLHRLFLCNGFSLMRSMKRFGYHAVHILFASFINKFLVCRFPSIFPRSSVFCIRVYFVIANWPWIRSPWPVAHSPWNWLRIFDCKCVKVSIFLGYNFQFDFFCHICSCSLCSTLYPDPFKINIR